MKLILFQFLPLLFSPVFLFLVIAYYQDYKRSKKNIGTGLKFIVWFVVFMVMYFGTAKVLNINIITSILAFGVFIPMILILKSILVKNS